MKGPLEIHGQASFSTEQDPGGKQFLEAEKIMVKRAWLSLVWPLEHYSHIPNFLGLNLLSVKWFGARCSLKYHG